MNQRAVTAIAGGVMILAALFVLWRDRKKSPKPAQGTPPAPAAPAEKPAPRADDPDPERQGAKS